MNRNQWDLPIWRVHDRLICRMVVFGVSRAVVSRKGSVTGNVDSEVGLSPVSLQLCT